MVVVARPPSKDNSGMDVPYSAAPLRIAVMKSIHNKTNEYLWLAWSLDYIDRVVAPERLAVFRRRCNVRYSEGAKHC